jgi:hypothetical protein
MFNSNFTRNISQISPCLLGLWLGWLQLTTSPAAFAADTLSVTDGAVTSAVVASPPETQLVREIPLISIPALEPFKLTNRRAIGSPIELHGFASVSVGIPDPDQLVNRLVETAIARDKERDYLEARARYHDKQWNQIMARSRDMLQYMTSYQGFETSSEAADVILEEKLKLKSKVAVELVRQKRLDAAHLQLTCALMQIATGLGLNNEQKKRTTIDSGLKEMIPLVGEEEASHSLDLLTSWAKQVTVPDSAFADEPWDALTLREKSMEVLTSSLQSDDVVKSVESRLHHYNHISNLSRATSKIVNTSLSVIAFSPTFASPAAQTLQFMYIAATGGPEEKKVLKEVYLDRCFESRLERLNEESMLLVSSHNNAILTHNPVLLCCTESFIQSLMSPHAETAATSTPVPTTTDTHHKAFGERI